MLFRLGKLIDERINAWAVWDLLTAGVDYLAPSAAKRARTDVHVRQLLVSETCGANGTEVDAIGIYIGRGGKKGNVYKWELRDLCNYWAFGNLMFENQQVISSTFDAARIGRPALDLLCHAMMTCPQEKVMILPPVVLSSNPITPGLSSLRGDKPGGSKLGV